uniref:Uncharacterized protein n=1 Tax=Hyaloperonospora arabidopsidis (strain Emoy2) TaxID=559515 RepID=M4B277_HYAAE
MTWKSWWIRLTLTSQDRVLLSKRLVDCSNCSRRRSTPLTVASARRSASATRSRTSWISLSTKAIRRPTLRSRSAIAPVSTGPSPPALQSRVPFQHDVPSPLFDGAGNKRWIVDSIDDHRDLATSACHGGSLRGAPCGKLETLRYLVR